MLEIKALRISYEHHGRKKTAIGPVSLMVNEGESLAVIGPSGCGKSTLLQHLAGIMPADEGIVRLKGKAISYRKDRISYMPQGYGLLPWKNVYQNCLLPYKVKKMSLSEEEKAYIEHLLQVLGLNSMKKRYPIALSGGQRQRAAIARTLGMKPQLLLMDEPFSALDAVMKDEAQEAFMKLWQEVHCTTVIVTHSIEEALYLGEKIAVMGDSPGRVIRLIDNPWFGKKTSYEESGYCKLMHTLKQEIKRGWYKDEKAEEA